MVNAEQGGHVPAKHETCYNESCMICDGGLFICTLCYLLEGSLTTECPKAFQTPETAHEVHAGRLDFRDGSWVTGISPHSPAAYR